MLTRAMKRVLRDLCKHNPMPRPRNPQVNRRQHATQMCAENAELRATLNKYVVDGKLGVVRSGMDCDCTQYHHEQVVDAPATVAAFKRWVDQHNESLDGPETMYFRRPQDVEPQYRSRDLALMAYEDGHPHVVHPVGYDELMPG